MYRYFVFVPVLVLLTISAYAKSGQTLKEKMTPPADSVERENVRIWVPIERPSACQLTINISDSSGRVVRHLVDFVARPGIYNFYWNKMDDSGNFVEPGTYHYEVDDCGKKSTGDLIATFKKWERESIITFFPDSSGFTLDLLEDSADVRIEWFFMNGRMAGRYYLRDDAPRGVYNFNWVGDHEGNNIVLIPQLSTGFYVQKVRIDEFIHVDTIRWTE